MVGAEAVVSPRFRNRDKSLKPSMLLFINYDKENNNNNAYDDNFCYCREIRFVEHVSTALERE